MKAVEFVKKHGWDAVINAVKSTNAEETAAFESKDLDPILAKNGSVIGFNVKVYRIKYGEVKRLVDSHELVESYGGYDLAKNVMQITPLRKSSYDLIENLKQAIADVESCK